MSNRPKRLFKGNNIIDFPDKYVVMDLETTGYDSKYDYIIEAAAIKAENGKITDTFQTFINNGFDLDEYYPDTVEWTGINQAMLNDAPDERSAINALYEFIGNEIIIGHNVNFDINFVYDTLLYYDDIKLDNNFIDTLRYARKLLPQLNQHRLADVANFFNVNSAGLHRSLRDCEITFECYTALCNLALETYGTLDNFKNAWKRKYKHKAGLKAADICADVDEFDETHPFFEKTLVFTGTLSLPRREAMKLAVNKGGFVGDSVTKKTNFLVLGNTDYCPNIKGNKSNKQKKAEKLKADGLDIEIITENVFFDILNN